MAKTVELKSIPATADIYSKAVAEMLPVIGKPAKVSAKAKVPDTVYAVSGLRVDKGKLLDYCLATGLDFRETLPLTYPFVLQFPLAMQTMVARDFPFGAVGSVHVENVIRRHRLIDITEPIDIKTHAENLREHRRGMLVDVISKIYVGSELATEQVSTFLKQQRTSLSDEPRGPAPKAKRPTPPDRIIAVDQSLIHRYAAASGDRNPIHMSNLSAKAFGFPRAIAHGMWSAATAVANVEGQLPVDVTYSVRFGKPIFLPSKVFGYTSELGGGNFDLSVNDRKKGFPHLTATVRS
ncbi:MaoC/PaaZ C-terminal domain-containing protein [Gordonia jinhuaensis]|uniref:Dehydratase n=1 Tax=Gordonia jinhuaensis TaxID=1517702 RepID=A0A916TII8_9ACTN|nr:MaoC/PaaZ C-terminal domain-containing protein [Gordonia jinhuaensis]GGB46106.1 dehydratase [Gordonia jinhuaensis]